MTQPAQIPLLFGLSCLLTGAGLLVGTVPFFVAYSPFAIALVAAPVFAHPRLAVLALMVGHFLWPALISGWGLVQLGTHPLAVVVGGIAAVMGVSAGVTWLGIGLSALVLAALPFFPANPLLVTGSILPGAGLWGLLALPACVTLIESQSRILIRAALLVALLLLPRLMTSHPNPSQAEAAKTATYEEIDISEDRALTERGYWAQILSRLEKGDTVILGENIFAHDDLAAIFWWCRAVQTRGITAMIGVLGHGGLGEVWRFDAATCPEPSPVHRAVIGIPMANSGWGPKKVVFEQDTGVGAPPSSEPHWLICFEAFSLWRWVEVGMNRSDNSVNRPVVILANDYWTAPFATATLRRKVAGQFAALYGVEVFHADSGKTVLQMRRKLRNSA